MKKILLVLAAASAIFATACGKSDELKVMSYNIRLDNAKDGENAWPNRKEATIEMINTLKPDVFGVQEALPHQVQYLKENDCDKYYKYNKRLLFDEQQEQVLEQLDEIETGLNSALK